MRRNQTPVTDKKAISVSFRCTVGLNRQIEAKAKHMEEKKSKFISDCIEAGLKRKTRYDKGKARALVEMQEDLNHMIRNIGNEQQGLKEEILKYEERTMKLWEF